MEGPLQLLVRNTSQVLTLEGRPDEPAERALTPAAHACVGVRGGRVAYVGPEAALAPGAVGAGTRVLDAAGGLVGPGFVDAHTHLVFAGERSREFELRCLGASYLDIARAGGGILSTVRATRAASEEQLVQLALPRLARLLAHGVTTAEVKSGYGLTVPDELRILRAVREASRRSPVTLVPTLLCAHALPEEYQGRREAYLARCTQELLPAVAEAGLARSCDAFVEEGAFGAEEVRPLLEAARALGLGVRVHAEQLGPSGGARLAAALGAASADHLEHVSDEDIRALAAAGTSAVLVPTSTLFLRLPRYAPGRRLRDAGLNVALGTNLNPGSAMSESVPLALGLACLGCGLSAAEAYWAATRGAALALGLPDAGRLAPGDPADLVLFSCEDVSHLPYHLGINHVRMVVKAGEVVHQAEPLRCA
jgi:imidazolonepropionase